MNPRLNIPLTKKVWKNRRILILGLGQYPQGSGVSAALLFARLGAKVTVTDLKTSNVLGDNVKRLKKFKSVRFVLGRHDLKDVRAAEFIVPNQRVRQNSPEMTLARKLVIPVQTEIALFLNHCPARIVGITGTRGKSTTTAMIAHLLTGRTGRQDGQDDRTENQTSQQDSVRPVVPSSRRPVPKVWLGGNILVSPLTFLSKIKKDDIVVLELSSFQTELLADARPVDIAVVTNIKRDHLNAYGSMEEYAEAKAQIFRYQKRNQVVILNADDDYGRAWMKEAPSRVVTSSSRDRLPISKSNFPLLGEHNVMNAHAAVAAARAAGASMDQIKRGLKTFKPLPHRLETVHVWRNIRFVNDTTATTPDGTIAAIEALADHHHLWLIAGGADKELEYVELAKTVKKHHPRIHILLLPGDASEKIKNALSRFKEHIHPVLNIRQAVALARRSAIPGDAVVLSPGAASFNQFKNEFERGEEFVRAVKSLL